MHIFSTLEKLLKTKSDIVEKVEVLKNQRIEEVNTPIEDSVELVEVQQQSKDYSEKKNIKEKVIDRNTCYVLFPKDGDTFVGMHQNEKKTFRLAGINTPEKGQPGAKEATEFLRENIGKKVVYLTFLGKDKYDREIVEVFLDKERKLNLNEKLIELGLAKSERYKDANGNYTHSTLEYAKHELKEKIALLHSYRQADVPSETNENEEINPMPTKKRFGNNR